MTEYYFIYQLLIAYWWTQLADFDQEFLNMQKNFNIMEPYTMSDYMRWIHAKE